MTKSQAATLRRKIHRFVRATEDDSWKGGGDPDCIPEIEKEVKDATGDLRKYIDSLTEPTP